jgi:glucose/arabinose dehydrogenase
MRLTAEGRTPADQPSGPLFASNLRAPRSLAWDGSGASLWVADAGAARLTRLRTRGRRTTATLYRLPLTQGPASAVIYRGALMPAFAGDLLVASIEDSPSVLRVRLANDDTVSATEPLTLLGSGSVRVVKVGPDGALYALTDDAVLRITPRD